MRDTTCPKCHTQPVSLGRVPSACTPNVGLIHDRHNTILQRVVRAIDKEGKDLFVEQTISPDSLHPDIVLRKTATRETVVVDITVAYESGKDALGKARAEKESKYAGLKAWLDGRKDKYSSTSVHVLVVGSLGSWDPENSGTWNRDKL